MTGTLVDWRGETLARIRSLIEQVDPEIVEERKWAKPSNPSWVRTWSHDGIICTGETYRDKVKLTFAEGASLEDPSGLFNSSLRRQHQAAPSTFMRAARSMKRRLKRSSEPRWR